MYCRRKILNDKTLASKNIKHHSYHFSPCLVLWLTLPQFDQVSMRVYDFLEIVYHGVIGTAGVDVFLPEHGIQHPKALLVLLTQSSVRRYADSGVFFDYMMKYQHNSTNTVIWKHTKHKEVTNHITTKLCMYVGLCIKLHTYLINGKGILWYFRAPNTFLFKLISFISIN